MVVMTIIVVITGIALTSNSSFNKTLIVSNAAYDVALTLRSAESYGLSSRAASGSVVNAGYGLNFKKTSPSSFTFFADTYPAASTASVCHPVSDASAPSALPGNCAYDATQGEKVITYAIGSGVTIADFCAFSGSSWSCANSNGNSLTSLDIVFARPNPDAFMSVNGAYSSSLPVTAACIKLTSPQGGTRAVSIISSGSISASATTCP